ncbi:LOW QUALITY PROTEIN: hypothetical protein SORBI_3006G099001 [Sorghum bicolor]|uniref:Uncharacterized protein n=1 Tax=Sorghum bicolor TaxID=4558 RepID=A0A1Z5RDZ2_SORBI|nr:LOW QUALITY PROTEIN: hypothetical protein SORBI_3006G099001 [Sorghum bicolor]
MASAAVFFTLIIITAMAGGSARELTPPGSTGGELAPLASAAGGRARGKFALMTATPGSAGGLTATLPGSVAAGGSASEIMPAGSAGAATTAGISPLLRKKLTLLLDQLDFGRNCSSLDCIGCLLETIGSCLAHGLTCVHPGTMVECFVGKFIIIEHCFGTGERMTLGSAGGAGAEGELMPRPGSTGGGAGELTTPAGGSSTTRTAGVSALLRQELALADLGSNCSDNCKHCLLDNILSCSFDAATCVDPWEFIRCLVENFFALKECFGTKPT